MSDVVSYDPPIFDALNIEAHIVAPANFFCTFVDSIMGLCGQLRIPLELLVCLSFLGAIGLYAVFKSRPSEPEGAATTISSLENVILDCGRQQCHALRVRLLRDCIQ